MRVFYEFEKVLQNPLGCVGLSSSTDDDDLYGSDDFGSEDYM